MILNWLKCYHQRISWKTFNLEITLFIFIFYTKLYSLHCSVSSLFFLFGYESVSLTCLDNFGNIVWCHWLSFCTNFLEQERSLQLTTMISAEKVYPSTSHTVNRHYIMMGTFTLVGTFLLSWNTNDPSSNHNWNGLLWSVLLLLPVYLFRCVALFLWLCIWNFIEWRIWMPFYLIQVSR